jgi:thiosulfate/3-mercaptopyruvate sulfurtransferase
MTHTLITPRQLAGRLNDADVKVIDCRFDLTRPEWGAESYAAARIPRALYAHLDRDLSSPVSPLSGRHPLPTAEALAARCDRWGIAPQTQVVAYDQGPGAYAARLWWLLRWLGHRRVAVLDGGFAAWQDEKLAIEHGPVVGSRARVAGEALEARGDRTMLVSTAEVARAVATGMLARAEWVLVDARSADRFAGRNETLDAVAGHVPGARNHPFTENLDAQGRFLDRGTLRERFARTLAGEPPHAVVSMCGSGVTACHNLLAMEVAGLGGARLYAGSWSEWIRDPDRPIETNS